MNVKWCIHSGDRGDVIYFLPVAREMGFNGICLIPSSGTREQMTPAVAESLEGLLLEQPYIDIVSFNRQPGDASANGFRDLFFKNMKENYQDARLVNLTDWHARHFGLADGLGNEKWLNIEPVTVGKYVFSRTPRYRNNQFPWLWIYEKFGKDAVFVGTEREHVDFVRDFGKIQRVNTLDLYDVASVIAGCDTFFGNQSCPFAIAEGLKHKSVLEVWHGNPNTLFDRANVVHGWHYKQTIEDIEKLLL